MSTILITGCSSGFGLETARYFLERDWTVIATMRKPKPELFAASSNVRILPLDVTDAASIARAVEAAGPIDVLVNNAGVGLLNAVEGMEMDQAREVFETNTLGTIAMAKAFVPQFREQRAGVIVNVTSTVTVRPLNLLSVYTASKAAVNAFTECLAADLEPFGVRARIVLPGLSVETSFGDNARARMGMDIPPAYAEKAAEIFANFHKETDLITRPRDVAEAIWRAATDPNCPMRLPAGKDAVEWVRQAGSVMA